MEATGVRKSKATGDEKPLEERVSFVTPRRFEYWSEPGLQLKIGFERVQWPLVIAKELIDNALDACEMSETEPHISVVLTADTLTVEDNGPGIPDETVRESFNYDVTMSSKKHYVSPTRGQLGNALKCAYAAPWVQTGSGSVEVHARGTKHVITSSRDALRQGPSLPCVTKASKRGAGTAIAIHWKGIAALPTQYKGESTNMELALHELIEDFAALNPHASFTVKTQIGELPYRASNPMWKKWRSKGDNAGSPHWYRPRELRELIQAFIEDDERRKSKPLLLREFLRKFEGLTSTKLQKEVMKDADLSKVTHLIEIVVDRTVDETKVGELLYAMQRHVKKVSPKYLGIVGKEHMFCSMGQRDVEESETYKPGYKSDLQTDRFGLPYVVEASFGVKRQEERRSVVIGLNHSPTLELPYDLDTFLTANKIDGDDPIALLVNIVFPRLSLKDSGKSQVYFTGDMEKSLNRVLTSVTKVFVTNKKPGATRDDLRGIKQASGETIKAVAYEIMEQAYMKASADNTLPANARQIMYAARPTILARLNLSSLEDETFFKILTKYLIEKKEETAQWNVVYDARGHLVEPHVRSRLGLGTLEVNRYVNSWGTTTADLDVEIEELYPTSGPKNRFKFALFIEKEGFDPLLGSSGIAELYDLAIFSSKGQSTTATRLLVDKLSQDGVTILVVHDFDRAGMGIFHNLGHGTKEDPYYFETEPTVINLGLTLKDAWDMGLESEPDPVTQKKDPRIILRDYGATEDEANLLAGESTTQRKEAKEIVVWEGARIELNAMTSGQFVEWLKRKLDEHGVTKVLPDETTLAAAWKRADRISRIKAAIAEIEADETDVPVPDELQSRVEERLALEPELSWDRALVRIASQMKN